MSPQEDLGSALGGGQVDLPGALLGATTPSVPPGGGGTPPVGPVGGVTVPQFNGESESGDTQSVPAGTTAAVVPGTFTPPYVVGVVAGWATDCAVYQSDKLETGFIVNFNIPPHATNSFDWRVTGS